MNDALRLGLYLHDGEVGIGFAGALAPSRFLNAIEVNECDFVGFEFAFRAQRRSAEYEVVTDTNGNVSSIAIDHVTGPHLVSNVGHFLFEFLNLR